jgi:hypothetical protein
VSGPSERIRHDLMEGTVYGRLRKNVKTSIRPKFDVRKRTMVKSMGRV